MYVRQDKIMYVRQDVRCTGNCLPVEHWVYFINNNNDADEEDNNNNNLIIIIIIVKGRTKINNITLIQQLNNQISLIKWINEMDLFNLLKYTQCCRKFLGKCTLTILAW